MGSEINPLIAVDVALVPPQWVQERAFRVNAELLSGGLRLDATHIPHISLAQFFVFRGAVPLLTERLDLVLRQTPALPISVLTVMEQHSAITFLLDRSPELLELHENIMDAIKQWEEPGGDGEAFYPGGEPARGKDVEWVANYRTAASYRKFIPHITLGFGHTTVGAEPFKFLAQRVGLFHLGRFCACRGLLHEWSLE